MKIACLTVKVYDDLEVVLLGPSNSFVEVGKLSLDKWFTPRNIESPVANGESDMVKSVYRGKLPT